MLRLRLRIMQSPNSRKGEVILEWIMQMGCQITLSPIVNGTIFGFVACLISDPEESKSLSSPAGKASSNFWKSLICEKEV